MWRLVQGVVLDVDVERHRLFGALGAPDERLDGAVEVGNCPNYESVIFPALLLKIVREVLQRLTRTVLQTYELPGVPRTPGRQRKALRRDALVFGP